MLRADRRLHRRCGATGAATRSLHAAVLLLFCARVAAAQTGRPVDLAEMTLDELLRIQVTGATKTELNRMEVPQAVSVLTRADIRRIAAHNLADLLRSVVGANVVRVQTSQNVLGTRGSNAFAPAQLLILIDGQPINPTLFSTTWWDLVPIAIGDIDRIEFIRSPGTIYGANAQHGVVNVITRQQGANADGSRLRVMSEVGQQRLGQHYVGYRGGLGSAAYNVSAEVMSIAAYENPSQREIVPGRPSARGEQTFTTHPEQLSVQNFYGAIRAPLFGHTFTSNVGVKHISSAQGRVPDRLCFVGIQGQIGFANVQYIMKSATTTHTATMAANVADYTFVRNADPSVPTAMVTAPAPITAGLSTQSLADRQLGSLWRRGDTETCDAAAEQADAEYEAPFAATASEAPSPIEPNALNPSSTRLATIAGSYEAQRAVGDRHHLLVGARYSLETGSNTGGQPFFTDARVTWSPTATAYLQDELTLGPTDRMYVGALLSQHYVAGTHVAPMIAYVHKLRDNHVVRVGSFTSYRNPNVFEDSMDYDQNTGAPTKRTRLVSNRDLEAERTTSYEAGVRSRLLARLLVSADVYWNTVSNGIEWRLVGVETAGGARPQYQSANTLRQRVHGFELEMKYDLGRIGDVETNLALTAVTNRSADPAYQGPDSAGATGVGQGRYGSDYVPPYVSNTILTLQALGSRVRLHYQMSGAHTWQWPSWSSATGVDSFGLKPVPAYGVLNASVSFNVAPNVTFDVRGNNVLNVLHTEWRGDESYFGRSVSAKVSVRLRTSRAQ